VRDGRSQAHHAQCIGDDLDNMADRDGVASSPCQTFEVEQARDIGRRDDVRARVAMRSDAVP
jgi:hypothetical protein